MSKRGRRRNSKRRKSSSSSKQSPSPFTIPKQNTSDSACYKDDTVEKGETDSLRKETVLSKSEDEEHPCRSENKYKQEYNVDSSPGHRSVYTKTTVVGEKAVKIVTSVSVRDIENSSPKVVFQHSCEPSSENPSNSSTPVTNIFNINCNELQMKLEIQETLQVNPFGIERTCVFKNENRDSAEMISKRKCDGTWIPDHESSEQPSRTGTGHNENQTITSSFTYGSMSKQTEDRIDSESVCSTNIWGKLNYCHCCSNYTQQKAVDLNHSSCSAFLLKRKPEGERKYSGDQFGHVPPPQQFADRKYYTLEDLTQDLASFRIAACSPADKHQRTFHQTFSTEFRSLFSGHAEEREAVTPFDLLSEPDNYEPMFMRPSTSTNRSSFTNDFIYCQRKKSWVRKNSIATVESRICSLLRKRRQTFPGMSVGPGSIEEDLLLPCNKSFSSFIMCSLPFQTEKPVKRKLFDERFSTFERRRQSFGSILEDPKTHKGEQPFSKSFCITSSNKKHDMCPTHEQDQTKNSKKKQDIDLKHSTENLHSIDCEHKDDQRELVDLGLDTRKVYNLEPFGEEVHQRSFAIQVIPPPCSGSGKLMAQTDPCILFEDGEAKSLRTNDSVLVSPEDSKSSVMTASGDPLGQNVLQKNLKLSLSIENCAEKSLQRVLEDVCMPTSQDIEVNLLQKNEVAEKAEPKTVSSPTLQLTSDETNNMKVVEEEIATEESNKPADSSLYHTDKAVNTKELLIRTTKTDKQLVYRSSSETKNHLKPLLHKDRDSGVTDHWAKRRKLFKESREWSSAGGNSVTSDLTEESVSEDTHSTDMAVQDNEDMGFYTETFHSSAWIYQGDDVCSGDIRYSLITRTRPESIRERTVKINKGMGEYPWGFRIQFSKPIVVTEVDTNGAAEEAELMVGDYVLAVNGTDVTSIPHSEAAKLARQGPDVLILTIGSDIGRGPNTPRPPCRGYLHKRTQSGLIKGWRKRWFVLTHDCCLYYYKHKRDEGKRQPLASVQLEGAVVGPDKSLGKPFVFKCHPQSGNRVYVLCATSNQEMKRWLEAMERAIHPITQNHVWIDVTRHNSNLPPLAVKNPDCLGLLHKMDKSKDTSVQYYCILKDGCLYLYSGIRATHAHGGIYLQGYMVREQPHGSKKSIIELKPPLDEFKTFYFCAENFAENKRWISAIKASIKKWLPLHQVLQECMNQPPEETRM